MVPVMPAETAALESNPQTGSVPRCISRGIVDRAIVCQPRLPFFDVYLVTQAIKSAQELRVSEQSMHHSEVVLWVKDLNATNRPKSAICVSELWQCYAI